MGDCNTATHERTPSVRDITVVFHKVDCHEQNQNSDHEYDECNDAAEHLPLRGDCRVSHGYGFGEDDDAACDDAPRKEEVTGRHNSLEGGKKQTPLCPPAFCVRSEPACEEGTGEQQVEEKPNGCPGLGLFYAFLSTVLFSVIALLVKTIQELHAIEISGLRCFFQMLFVMPLLIYHKTGFLGPRDKRIFLVLRGFTGSNAMILLYYAVKQMPLADATVIMFSNPVFTSLLAWIFLKEKCTIWDCVFTVFTLTGVILIARPPFIFGENLYGIEDNYTDHIKGAIAAFVGAIAVAFTFVVLRKMGKSVHYYLSVWYYAVIGLIECVITVSILGEWRIPHCGRDRWIMLLIAILGIAGQTFLTKALQIEKAGPVSLMRTVDVVLAFILQFIFFNRAPTWWSLGGALCIVLSTSGVAVRKWYTSTQRSRTPVTTEQN